MAASMEPGEDLLKEDYYSFLNVRKEASKQEINDAYRRLCKVFHPDRHVDLEKKKQAEKIFQKLKKIHETLVDDHKRVVYDLYGEKGLESYGMEVISRVKTPAEIIAEYKRYQEEQEQIRLNKRTNPQGTVSVGFNATDLFLHDDDEEDEDEDDRRDAPITFSSRRRSDLGISMAQMELQQSVECPLTTNHTVVVSGHVGTFGRNGEGTLNVNLRTVTSPWGWREIEASVGSKPSLSFRGSRQITKKCQGSASIVWTPRSLHRGLMPTGLRFALVYQFDKNFKGQLRYNPLFPSGLNSLLVYDSEKHRCLFSVQLGIARSFVLTSYTHKFPERESELSLTFKAGTDGIVGSYGVKKKISSFSTLAATMEVGVPTGITLRIMVSRGQQNFVFPVLLSEELDPTVVFFGTVIPVVTYFLVKKTIIDPFLTDQKKKEMQKTREEQAEKIAQKKREAEAVVDLMKETVENSMEVEENKNGLVIVKGLYGKLVTDNQSELDHRACIDVTIPLQSLVKDSKLIEPNGLSKCNLPGFYDPCVGEDKRLYIRYKFRNRIHQVTILDLEPIRLPQQKHLIQDDSSSRGPNT